MSDTTNPYTSTISPGEADSQVDAATLDGASLSTDGTLAGDSDLLVSTQKAVKTYADNLDTALDTRLDDYETNVVIDGSGDVTITNDLTASNDLSVSNDGDVINDLSVGNNLSVTGSAAISSTINGETLVLDKADGTAPMTITSTTLVSNLNVDQVDGCDVDDNDSLGTSDVKLSTQGNIKSYVDSKLGKNLSSKTITAATYTITDSDMTDYDMIEFDTTSNSIVVTLADRATNNGETILIKHSIQGSTNIVTINRAGSDVITQDGLTSIELPKEQNFIEIFGSSVVSAWEILSEQIFARLRLTSYNGFGSTENKIMKFTTVQENIGNMFTENHVSGYNGNTEGLKIIPKRSGRYYFSFSGGSTQPILGLSLNSTQLTTDIRSITAIDRLEYIFDNGGVNLWPAVSNADSFIKDDEIRPHTNGGAVANPVYFIAEYLGQ